MWLDEGKAVARYYKGIFYIKLTYESKEEVKKVVCGVDPGSKREAFTVKSAKKTYINILADEREEM